MKQEMARIDAERVERQRERLHVEEQLFKYQGALEMARHVGAQEKVPELEGAIGQLLVQRDQVGQRLAELDAQYGGKRNTSIRLPAPNLSG